MPLKSIFIFLQYTLFCPVEIFFKEGRELNKETLFLI